MLNNRSVLAISGPQASKFLQGLITNDMDRLETQRAIYAALLTPQGKILFDFLVIKADREKFYVDCDRSRVDDLVRRLTLYRLRAKVEILETPLGVAGSWDANELPALSEDAIVFDDPRLVELGQRIIAPAEELKGKFPDAENSYEAHRIALGVPGSADLSTDAVFALDAGFEELHGVSFNKGCYVGQEVTSRMKHRANARKRFFIVEAGQGCSPGAALEADGKSFGTLASGDGKFALALVRLDRIPKDATLVSCAGSPVTLTAPKWLRLEEFGDA
jgi:folate-binding protein YgfZ